MTTLLVTAAALQGGVPLPRLFGPVPDAARDLSVSERVSMLASHPVAAEGWSTEAIGKEFNVSRFWRVLLVACIR